MKNLLRKEISLSMHPTVPIFLLLSAMLLIPNYPYYVIFFYTSLAVFFTCLNGRENNDISYMMLLPIAKKDIVRGRFLFVVLYETAQFLVAIPFAVLRQRMPLPGNQVGMDANIALFGFSLLMMGGFNFSFFTMYYRDVQKVGKSFVVASTGMFLYISVVEVCAHLVPFMRDKLDTKDPQFLGEKLAVLAVGAACYLFLTTAAYHKSVRSFEKYDLQ